MGDDTRIFADMALHALETDIADLERLTQLPVELHAVKAEEARLSSCLERLWNLVKTVQQKAAA